MKNIAFDYGFGNLKALDDQGNSIIFPTLIQLYRGKMDQDVSDFKYISTVNGKKYAVGEFASFNKGSGIWDDRQQLDMRNLSVYLGTALHLISNSSEEVEEVNISVGLPIDFYNEQKSDLENLLFDLRIEVEINEVKKTFHINEVIITQQGVGAFIAVNVDVYGKLKTEIDLDLERFGGGIIDVGYRTIDYVKIDTINQMFALNELESGSFDNMGINSAHREATSEINNLLGTNFNVIFFENYLNQHNGIMTISKKEIDLKPYFNDAYKMLANDIKTKILKQWADISTFGAVYLTGGGAQLIKPYININGVEIKVQNNSCFANAEGYLAKLSMKLNRKTEQKELATATTN